MQTVDTAEALRQIIAARRHEGLRIAFVPTMGNLHAGHMRLVDHARTEADYVVASIFVNPMQFGANEDLDTYPRTLEADQTLLTQHGADLLFFPAVADMYPNGLSAQTRVTVPDLPDTLCGAHRPGHFDGVSTVVTKLFNLVQPDCAIFGEKDFQQLSVIRKMTSDLCLPIDIIGVPTVRANDGLALSSRNGYLSDNERQQATEIYRTLCDMREQLIEIGTIDPEKIESIEKAAEARLSEAGFFVDYITFRDPKTLRSPSSGNEIVALAAASLGNTRLIDNVTFMLQTS